MAERKDNGTIVTIKQNNNDGTLVRKGKHTATIDVMSFKGLKTNRRSRF
jgi:hypothetical protein